MSEESTPIISLKKLHKTMLKSFHREIEHFYRVMSPTETEHKIRGEVVQRIEKIIISKWPEAQVEVFGSYRTGLYLPTSDIDLVVIGKWASLPLRSLEQEFLYKDVAVENSIRVLDRASVPIVKLVDKKTEIKVDISFNMSHGVKSAELIKTYIDKFPVLPKLVYILKQFLLERDLNELHPRQDFLRRSSNLGILLIEFFELYGRKFNYNNTGITVRDGGKYIHKEEMQKEMLDGHIPSMLCIEDPLEPSNDIGRGSYGVFCVKKAFEYAYTILGNVVHPLSPYNNCTQQSILGRIIRVRDKAVQQRQRVEDSARNRPSRSSSTRSTSSAEESGISSEGSDRRDNLQLCPPQSTPCAIESENQCVPRVHNQNNFSNNNNKYNRSKNSQTVISRRKIRDRKF